ncbi:MAG: FAD-dependent oxidoreductase [Burkholderiaceae bacterium]
MAKIAVIGAGISGLSCAYRLAQAGRDVTLFEANDYFGGHTHTVDVTQEGKTCGVDTGFLVFNHRTYPNLVRLFAELDIKTTPTDMSFSVKLPIGSPFGTRTLEWAGGDLGAVFAQRRNAFDPRFLRMVGDILRFNKQATALALAGDADMPPISLGAFLQQEAYSTQFRDWYLLPMAGCIWSCPTQQMLAFPLASFIHFCHNHGLLQVNDRPQWQTVVGGARHYVEKMLKGIPQTLLGTPVLSVSRHATVNGVQIQIRTAERGYLFDHVVMASHSDESLALLSDVTPPERRLLSAITYQPNRAVLHTDTRCLPANRKTWSAWNYQSDGAKDGHFAKVCVHYLINRLQPLPFAMPLIVSLNPLDEPDPGKILGIYDYAHPAFDVAAVAAQAEIATRQGRDNTWFAGAWMGYGFHEDGLKSGLAVASSLVELTSAASAAAFNRAAA